MSNGNGVSANGTPAHVTGSSKQKRSKTDNAAAGGDSSSVVREPRKERRSKSRDLDDKLTGKTEHRVKERRASKDKHAQNGKEKEKSSKEKKDRESKRDSKKDKEAKGESKKDRDSKKSRDSKKDKEVKKERTSQNARADKKGDFKSNIIYHVLSLFLLLLLSDLINAGKTLFKSHAAALIQTDSL